VTSDTMGRDLRNLNKATSKNTCELKKKKKSAPAPHMLPNSPSGKTSTYTSPSTFLSDTEISSVVTEGVAARAAGEPLFGLGLYRGAMADTRCT